MLDPTSLTRGRAGSSSGASDRGTMHESASDPCISGSITPPTQGKVKPITIYDKIFLEELNIRLTEQLKKETEKLRWGEEEWGEELTKIGDIHRILSSELRHIGNEPFIFTLDYQENINPKSEESLEPKGPLVTRFGIKPQAISAAIADKTYTIPLNKLHYIEQEIFERALRELNGQLSAEEFEELTAEKSEREGFAQNVVVVDILARDKSRNRVVLKEDPKTNLPETHAIVLWKRGKNDLVLIDPSNQEYSQHIANSLKLLHEELSVTLLKIEGGVIYATQGKPTGRSEYENSTPPPRDCIDIAVKIAFEINEQQKEGIASAAIRTRVYAQLSNQPALREDIDSMENISFIRELQSTNKEVRKDAKLFLKEHKAEIAKVIEILTLLKIESASLEVIKTAINTNWSSLNTELATIITILNKSKTPSIQEIYALINKAALNFDEPSPEKIEELFKVSIRSLKSVGLANFSLEQIEAAVDPQFNKVFQFFGEIKVAHPSIQVKHLKTLFGKSFHAFKEDKINPSVEQINALFQAMKEEEVKNSKGKAKAKGGSSSH